MEVDVDSLVSMETVANLLESVREKGVRLWVESGRLHYAAPKGVLAAEDIEKLRGASQDIVALLTRESTIGSTMAQQHLLQPNRAPLSFSQLAHWHLYHLGERRAIRQIASVTRLRGRLDVDALTRSLAEIVRRQAALRTRVAVRDGVPEQVISASADYEFRFDDLTASPESGRELEIMRVVDQHILQPIDIASGPLFGVRLLRTLKEEHVLVLAMEHMISDAFSMDILLRDLLTAYTQTRSGQWVLLPEIGIQFADYAIWQRNAERSFDQKRRELCNDRLRRCGRLRFYDDVYPHEENASGRGVVPIKIGRLLKAELGRWARLRRTTLAMVVFAAYVGLVLRWCKASEGVFRYLFNGRSSQKVENTIGFFASELYLHVALDGTEDFGGLISRVIEEYCEASSCALCSSSLVAQMSRPEFSKSTAFNWIPHAQILNSPSLGESEDPIECSPISFVHPMLKNLKLDLEPSILLYDMGDEVVGGLYFPKDRLSVGVMEKFRNNFVRFMEILLRKPESCVRDIMLV